MSDKRAKFTLFLEDLFSGNLTKAAGVLAVFRQGWMAVTSAVQTAVGVFQSVLNEYAKQETAISKLNIALKNQGIASQQVTDSYIAFANEMQNTTIYADEQVIEMQALLATFGVVGDEMERTIRLAADLSTGLGIDLRTATMMMGKAALGETGTLSRYGIVIADNIPKAQKFAEVTRQINERFGGAAAAQTETYAGKVALLSNKFSDIKESIGSALIPAFNKLSDVLIDTLKYWDKLFSVDTSKAASNARAIQTAKEEIKVLEERNRIVEKWRGTQVEEYKNNQTAIANRYKQIEALNAETAALEKKNKANYAGVNGKPGGVDPDEAKKAEEKKAKLMEDAQAQIDAATFTEEELANIKANAMAAELDKVGQHDLAVQVLEAQQTQNKKLEGEKRAANFKATMGVISTLSQSSNKTLAAVGKAAAITQATMDTYAAANVAMKSAPPPFNFALAALVTTAGLANVARISGVKLAEGGMLMPQSGGVPAIMAEAGRAEVAIPLDDPRTKEKLRDTFGGNSGINVTFQVGTLVADDRSLSELAQKMDEEIFKLRRNGRSYI